MRFQHEFFAFLAQASFYIDSIWFRHFRWDETQCSTTEYTDNFYPSCLPCPRQLSPRQLSRHAANGKLASFSAASCWCGVVWIWQYQRHSTACDDTDSASDGRLLAFYDQFIKDYRGSQVPVHWCFYERTGEQEMEYKRLMIVCRHSSAINDKTIMMATCLQLMQRTINMVIHHPSRSFIAYTLKTTREILCTQLKHCAN